MSQTVDAISHAARALSDAQAQGWTETELQQRLQDVTAETGLTIDVAWEKDEVSGRRVPDLLLTEPGLGTFLLSFGADDGRPWVVRGAQRHERAHLLTVGDEDVDVEQAVVALELLWKEPTVSRRIVENALLRRELRRSPLTLDPRDLEEYVQRFRRARGLFKAADFQAWLDARALTAEHFYARVEDEAKLLALKQRKASEAPSYFESHRLDFDRITMVHWRFATPADAERARRHLENATDIWAAFEIGPPEVTAGFAAELPVPVAVAARTGGRWLGPTTIDASLPSTSPEASSQAVHLYRVLKFEEARLDEATIAAVQERIWKRWIDQLRTELPVRWHWGHDDDGHRRTPLTEDLQT